MASGTIQSFGSRLLSGFIGAATLAVFVGNVNTISRQDSESLKTFADDMPSPIQALTLEGEFLNSLRNLYFQTQQHSERGGYQAMRNDDFEEPKRGNPPLHSEKIVTDRKIFFLDLKENDRGRVIKITEDVRGRRDTIMLPLEAADEFLDALQRILEAERDMQ